jgi:hypothetical protein
MPDKEEDSLSDSLDFNVHTKGKEVPKILPSKSSPLMQTVVPSYIPLVKPPKLEGKDKVPYYTYRELADPHTSSVLKECTNSTSDWLRQS